MTDADRKMWHDTALSMHEMQRVANAAAEAVTTLATQLTAAETLVKSAANPPASAKTQITDVGTKLADLRRRLGLNQQGGGGGGGGFGGQQGNVRGSLGQTKGQIMGSTSLPTAQQVRSSVELREDLTKVIADTNELISAIRTEDHKSLSPSARGACDPRAASPCSQRLRGDRCLRSAPHPRPLR